MAAVGYSVRGLVGRGDMKGTGGHSIAPKTMWE